MEQNKSIVTIADAFDAGWRIYAKCAQGNRMGMKSINTCLENNELDLKTLMWTRGEIFPLERLDSRMKCPRCWSRRVSVRFDTTANVKRSRMVVQP